MKRLKFEKVGDINSDFPYINVYLVDFDEPIIEIAVDEHNNIKFVMYKNNINDVVLSVENLKEILRVGEDFLPKALEDQKSELNRLTTRCE